MRRREVERPATARAISVAEQSHSLGADTQSSEDAQDDLCNAGDAFHYASVGEHRGGETAGQEKIRSH